METAVPASRSVVGLAHLSLLDSTPPDLVEIAAEAGFDFVGMRVHPATQGETPYPMSSGSSMLTRTCARLRDTGMHVRDIEVLTLDSHTTRQQWQPILDTGAQLGASSLNVIGADEDHARLADTLAALVEDATKVGIRPALEPITYRSIHTVPDAAALATRTGSAVFIDALHFHRFGGTLDQLQALDPDLLPLVQLCDAPRTAPETLAAPRTMPLGQSTDGSALQLESRAVRALPGHGQLPLAEFLAAFPAGTPISVEAPAIDLLADLGPHEFARRVRKAVSRLLDRFQNENMNDTTTRL